MIEQMKLTEEEIRKRIDWVKEKIRLEQKVSSSPSLSKKCVG